MNTRVSYLAVAFILAVQAFALDAEASSRIEDGLYLKEACNVYCRKSPQGQFFECPGANDVHSFSIVNVQGKGPVLIAGSYESAVRLLQTPGYLRDAVLKDSYTSVETVDGKTPTSIAKEVETLQWIRRSGQLTSIRTSKTLLLGSLVAASSRYSSEITADLDSDGALIYRSESKTVSNRLKLSRSQDRLAGSFNPESSVYRETKMVCRLKKSVLY